MEAEMVKETKAQAELEEVPLQWTSRDTRNCNKEVRPHRNLLFSSTSLIQRITDGAKVLKEEHICYFLCYVKLC